MYVLFDYQCRNPDCKDIGKVEERMIKRLQKDEQACATCKQVMKRMPGFPGGSHVSWSTWRI